jgi:hypothetical protein
MRATPNAGIRAKHKYNISKFATHFIFRIADFCPISDSCITGAVTRPQVVLLLVCCCPWRQSPTQRRIKRARCGHCHFRSSSSQPCSDDGSMVVPQHNLLTQPFSSQPAQVSGSFPFCSRGIALVRPVVHIGSISNIDNERPLIVLKAQA